MDYGSTISEHKPKLLFIALYHESQLGRVPQRQRCFFLILNYCDVQRPENVVVPPSFFENLLIIRKQSV